MVLYNPKKWITAIFDFHKADTFRALFFSLIMIALYSWGVVYLESEYLETWPNKQCKKSHHHAFIAWVCHFHAPGVSHQYRI